MSEVTQPQLRVAVVRLPHAAGLALPVYASATASGMDLVAALGADLPLLPGARALIPTGIAIALPSGFEAQVRARSGLALEHGLAVLNAPGTIDADYRGEIGVILANLGAKPYVVRRGERVAQLVVAPVARIEWAETAALPLSARGVGGFGSTGG